jgi:hypothetical protein
MLIDKIVKLKLQVLGSSAFSLKSVWGLFFEDINLQQMAAYTQKWLRIALLNLIQE